MSAAPCTAGATSPYLPFSQQDDRDDDDHGRGDRNLLGNYDHGRDDDDDDRIGDRDDGGGW